MSRFDDGPFLTLADYADLERRGRRAYGAQCVLCRYALNRGNLVIGCQRFENSKLDADTSGVLAAMLYQAAGAAKCPGRERLEIGPDAYRSEDLPQPDESTCSNPAGHVWNRSAAEADEARMSGDYANDNIRCVYCGANGDA